MIDQGSLNKLRKSCIEGRKKGIPVSYTFDNPFTKEDVEAVFNVFSSEGYIFMDDDATSVKATADYPRKVIGTFVYNCPFTDEDFEIVHERGQAYLKAKEERDKLVEERDMIRSLDEKQPLSKRMKSAITFLIMVAVVSVAFFVFYLVNKEAFFYIQNFLTVVNSARTDNPQYQDTPAQVIYFTLSFYFFVHWLITLLALINFLIEFGKQKKIRNKAMKLKKEKGDYQLDYEIAMSEAKMKKLGEKLPYWTYAPAFRVVMDSSKFQILDASNNNVLVTWTLD